MRKTVPLAIATCLLSAISVIRAQMPIQVPQKISLEYQLQKEAAGIAVSDDGRVFLALPRGGENHNLPSVVEMTGQKMTAFPNEEINKNINSDYDSHLVSVLGITIYQNTLWILDQGKRAGLEDIPDGSTKVVAVDINTRKVIKNIPIPKPFFRETMQLNDLRFDPTHGKQGMVYITNNGFSKPDQSIILLDVASGKLRELFKNIPEVSPAPGFITYVEGKPYLLDMEKPTMPQGGVNGIELSADFKKLIWTTPTNPNYYSISTDKISDFHASEADLKKEITSEGQIVSNGGIAVDEEGSIYFGDASRYSIIRKNTKGEVSLVAYDPRLIWPDGMAVKNGSLYVTIGQWHRLPNLNNGKDVRTQPYQVLKIPLK
ncbi:MULTISPECIES: L-dopachrome tautomerase-related protein [Chryseobacterium]|uniref:Sugar lactone lactonase YvrE n=1 Tax=Chryseobacterium camelliae TaxID=1265445 RepID=A0ABU0TGE4_9FLAO|nr:MULTISPECIES: L-dopachrome tautomerase-related protein [Chryseobacterium]MDT3406320.1 sugar lactone lactonase YvrE [Pseudacidovorax intermedius]MDQ1095881.1 sugar lactone lactonase YvrE [Chryseobacterium camelliae]MDQ1099818.1 sugar lactone lactonase YvrE [Chryseobacterium sp. SORGH_AS_1048]MDR6087164.1 sugar lactone lactonase YvrE [Chryseobacterium sp. SORGH_AS_0909]MDR6131537.1 sugar lactone lactonase YvrE [Chryseobacterium sp. SORGH_AS_1175]